ncbi:MAG: hypothetical protein MRZ65_03430 [Lachnospiraceae bacterium]|nr:hypothetical protein [Lachnospiraceae bacterium]
MKRNDLVARSLTLGLAVATAAASMSTPGGLMAPVTVQAAEQEVAAIGTTVTKMSDAVYATNNWVGKPETLTGFGEYDLAQTGNDIKVTGTAKYVSGFTGFSSETKEQSGYYLTWQFAIPDDAASIMWQSNGGTLNESGEVDSSSNGTTRKYKKIESSAWSDAQKIDGKKYFDCITYISPDDTDKNIRVIIATGVGGTTKETYTIDYSALKFESEIKAEGELKDAWNDVDAATGDSGITSVIKKAVFNKDEKAQNDLQINWYEGEVKTAEGLKDAAPVMDITKITKAGVYTYAVSYKEGSNYVNTDNNKTVIGTVTVGVDLSAATITLKNGQSTETTEFDYTGSPVNMSVEVADSKKGTVSSDNYIVYYTDGDADAPGTNTEAPQEVGAYKLWIAPKNGVSYGVNSKAFSIGSVKVTAGNIGDFLEYDNIAEGTLTYDMTDQSEEVKKKITKKSDLIALDDVEIFFKKNEDDTGYASFTDAGTYQVYASITAEGVTTETPVKIGTAVIGKYQPKSADITVHDTKVTYGIQPPKAEYIVDGVLEYENVTVTYKQGDKDVASPENAGEYDVYVAYTETDNCKAMEATATGKKLIITKHTDNTQFSQWVVKNDTTEPVSYDISAAVDEWTLAETDNSIDANVTVAEESKDYEKYVKDWGYDKENKAIKFTLTEDAKKLDVQTELLLHVDFGDSFNNHIVAFDIPVVITNKSPLNIKVENGSDLTYDGNAKELTFSVGDGADGGSTFEDISGKKASQIEHFAVTIKKGGKTVTEIKDAGRYIVTAVYDDDKYYGKMTWDGFVKAQKIDALTGLIALNSQSLTYDMTDHTEEILNAVKPVEGKGISKNDYRVRIDGKPTDAGTYGVYAEFINPNANYEADNELKVGEVTIAKGAITLNVTADSKGTPTIKVGNKTIAANDIHVSIQYLDKDGKGLESKPTAAGTYKVKVTYTDETNLTQAATGEATFTISGGSNTTTNTGNTTTTTTTPSTDDKKDDNKKDDNKTEDKATTTTETETKADGTQVTTTETKAEDGSVTARVELKNETTGVEATVKVAKDADGKVTDATAAVTQTSADKKAGISAATVAQITEAAGTKAVEIKAEIVDESGNTVCRLTANAEDLKAGNKLKVLKYDSKTGDYVLVNKTTYKVDKDGNVAMNDLKRASYMVVTASEAEAFSKQVLKTVKVETAKKNVTAGKKTKITLDDGLNMANVAKITYKTSRKSVATVNKNGTITTKKAGTVTIRATVTLKNGETKSVKMTLTVKKAK